MPTPAIQTRTLTIACLVLLSPVFCLSRPLLAAQSTEGDLGDSIERILESVLPTPPTPPPPSTPSPTSQPPRTAPATTAAPTTTRNPAVTEASEQPVASTTNTKQPDTGSNIAALLCGLLAAAVAMVGARWRRVRQHTTSRRELANADRHGDDQSVRSIHDGTEASWIQRELRFLATQLPASARRRMTIEFVQVSSPRCLEVAFGEVTEVTPPGNWTSAADRVWRLDTPHDDSLLADVWHAPLVLPVLVSLSDQSDVGHLYLNLGSAAGINLDGDLESVVAWLASAISEMPDQARGGRSIVRFVGDDPFDAFEPLHGGETISEAEAIELALDVIEDNPHSESASMLDRRTGRWESSPTLSLALVGEVCDDRWDQIAASPAIAVLSTSRRFESGINIVVTDGTISIPSLGIKHPTTARNKSQRLTMNADVKRPGRCVTDQDSVGVNSEEDVVAESQHTTSAPPASVDRGDDWRPPTWPVMINVLGAPHATRDGSPIKLTPQQLSALALIAMKREIPAHDFRRSIWGDQDDVSPERVRDMLSQLRKKVGGLRVIPKREDGLVCAGDDLGSDTLVFEALLTRSAAAPDEEVERLREALDLVTGRAMNYSTSDSAWWCWSEIAFGATDWTAKTTEAAASLSRRYLEASEPAAARDIAERGLVADPLNASLTELLMEAYAELGQLETVRRVYESHDRSLDMADLGGASAETRRLLERTQTPIDQPADEDASV